jgi:hypothetical protein
VIRTLIGHDELLRFAIVSGFCNSPVLVHVRLRPRVALAGRVDRDRPSSKPLLSRPLVEVLTSGVDPDGAASLGCGIWLRDGRGGRRVPPSPTPPLAQVPGKRRRVV